MFDISVHNTTLENILPFREMYLKENPFQIRYHACHERNWSDSYLVALGGKNIGYGSIKGLDKLDDRDTIFEFFVLPSYRKYAATCFQALIKISIAQFIEAQSNDFLQSAMLYEFAEAIQSGVMLFEDIQTTSFHFPDLVFRLRQAGEQPFGKTEQDTGQYVLIKDEIIVADGGFLTHYNPPFADLYMEVAADQRQKGYGSYILQEIKKECYLAGRIPAARCNIRNKASRATLAKTGFRNNGFMLQGKIKTLG